MPREFVSATGDKKVKIWLNNPVIFIDANIVINDAKMVAKSILELNLNFSLLTEKTFFVFDTKQTIPKATKNIASDKNILI